MSDILVFLFFTVLLRILLLLMQCVPCTSDVYKYSHTSADRSPYSAKRSPTDIIIVVVVVVVIIIIIIFFFFF
jgi:heme/copper-type cytochrome/quinol oxidase subunit 2